MSFYAKAFNYDGIDSDMYNLQIANLDSGLTTNDGSGTVEIIDAFIYRRVKPYFYGIQYDSKLEFPISFFSPDEITAPMLSFIQNWLFGKLQYKQLAIIQNDMDDVYIKCIFTEPTIIKAGNVAVGISGTCRMDSQFAYLYPKTLTYASPLPTSITIYNNSHHPDYLYPTLEFTMGLSGGNFSITNTSDSDRIFTFTGLSASETISVNNDLGIVNSSSGSPVLSKFNKNFLRLIPGKNVLTLSGASVSKFDLTYQFLRRIGP